MRRWIPLAVLALCSGAAVASSDFYLGAGYVTTDAEFDQAFENFETDDSAYKFYAGFRVFRFLDIEGSYRDLGAHQDSSAARRLNVDLEAYDIAARGVIPLGPQVSVFARAGYANVSRNGELELSGVADIVDEDDWELTMGAGVEFKFGEHFGLRAEWEEYDVDESLNSFSAGAFLRF